MSTEATALRLLRANALTLPLADESVDLIVTSPPYFALRSYKDGGEHYDGQIGAETTPGEFLDALITATREMMRVLKPSGSIWVNLGDKYQQPAGREGPMKMARERAGEFGGRARRPEFQVVPPKSLVGMPWRYALRCVDDLGLVLRAEVIWAKRNGLPESVTDRVARKHEQFFHFTKEARYFSSVDAIREPRAATSLKRAQPHRANVKAHEDSHTIKMEKACHPLGKLPGSVWSIATEPLRVDPALGVEHFAAFPTEWPRRIIAGWCPEDGVVLDPFGGSGTTAAVAEAMGRVGVSCDLSWDYLRLARWRIAGDGYRKVKAKVERSTRERGGALPGVRPLVTSADEPTLF